MPRMIIGNNQEAQDILNEYVQERLCEAECGAVCFSGNTLLSYCAPSVNVKTVTVATVCGRLRVRL